MEEWREIPGREGYQVSSHGRVRSFHRREEGVILSQFWVGGKKKYLSCTLFCPIKKMISVHSLVALAFIGPRPEGLVVDHIDNDQSNNRADNLQYITSRENNLKDMKVNVLGRGVRRTKYGTYLASITEGGKLKYLGTYKTPEEAALAYQNYLK